MDGTQAPLAYLITWTTYGTWLPGDARGWVEGRTGELHRGEPSRTESAQAAMGAVTLGQHERQVVEATIRDHCRIRRWSLHALNVRSNHVHVVVTADAPPEDVMGQFKAWCSRRLNERSVGASRQKWWTRHGSTRWINDSGYLGNAVRYVVEGQGTVGVYEPEAQARESPKTHDRDGLSE
jgi:REP element-mobilizing transposase RayT